MTNFYVKLLLSKLLTSIQYVLFIELELLYNTFLVPKFIIVCIYISIISRIIVLKPIKKKS